MVSSQLMLSLLACEPRDEFACPRTHREALEFERLGQNRSDGYDVDESMMDQAVEFHDLSSLNDWWLAAGNNEPIDDAGIDFSSQQAVGVLTQYDSEEDDGSLLRSVQWTNFLENELVFWIGFRCGGGVESVRNYVQDVFVTPIVPAYACHMEKCVHEWDD